MIKIVISNEKEVNDFGAKSWKALDKEHFGREFNWEEKEYFYKAVDSGKMIGMICGKYESNSLWIDNLIVDLSRRGGGIGSMLLNKALEFGKSNNAKSAWLITGKGWDSVKFWQVNNFKIIGVLKKYRASRDFVILSRSFN